MSDTSSADSDYISATDNEEYDSDEGSTGSSAGSSDSESAEQEQENVPHQINEVVSLRAQRIPRAIFSGTHIYSELLPSGEELVTIHCKYDPPIFVHQSLHRNNSEGSLRIFVPHYPLYGTGLHLVASIKFNTDRSFSVFYPLSDPALNAPTIPPPGPIYLFMNYQTQQGVPAFDDIVPPSFREQSHNETPLNISGVSSWNAVDYPPPPEFLPLYQARRTVPAFDDRVPPSFRGQSYNETPSNFSGMSSWNAAYQPPSPGFVPIINANYQATRIVSAFDDRVPPSFRGQSYNETPSNISGMSSWNAAYNQPPSPGFVPIINANNQAPRRISAFDERVPPSFREQSNNETPSNISRTSPWNAPDYSPPPEFVPSNNTNYQSRRRVPAIDDRVPTSFREQRNNETLSNISEMSSSNATAQSPAPGIVPINNTNNQVRRRISAFDERVPPSFREQSNNETSSNISEISTSNATVQPPAPRFLPMIPMIRGVFAGPYSRQHIVSGTQSNNSEGSNTSENNTQALPEEDVD